VLAQHLLNRFQLAGKLGLGTIAIGSFGVFLFFVHTCLVLMYSMERSNLDGRRLADNFYIRRIFRIYPLSIFAVLAAVALHLDSGAEGIQGLSHATSISTGRILSNLFLVQNLIKPGSIVNVLWSLPYEVQMYIFLPFLFLWIRGRRNALRRLAILWAAAVVVAIVHRQVAGTFPLDRFWLVQYVPCFFARHDRICSAAHSPSEVFSVAPVHPDPGMHLRDLSIHSDGMGPVPASGISDPIFWGNKNQLVALDQPPHSHLLVRHLSFSSVLHLAGC